MTRPGRSCKKHFPRSPSASSQSIANSRKRRKTKEHSEWTCGLEVEQDQHFKQAQLRNSPSSAWWVQKSLLKESCRPNHATSRWVHFLLQMGPLFFGDGTLTPGIPTPGQPRHCSYLRYERHFRYYDAAPTQGSTSANSVPFAVCSLRELSCVWTRSCIQEADENRCSGRTVEPNGKFPSRREGLWPIDGMTFGE